jgi:REP element-mobilizing transposase RayT
MTVRFKQPHNSGVYFITFTCFQWLPIIQLTNGYHLIYKWFDFLKSKGNYIVGYVIMPNHLHAIIAFTHTHQTINTQVGNGKRFLAYGLVNLLKQSGNEELLQLLQNGVNATEKSRGKLHQVFKASFDCKECTGDKMIETKLNYIHKNPCNGKWNLATTPVDYAHSSARFYATGKQGFYPVLSFMDLKDVDFSNGKQ